MGSWAAAARLCLPALQPVPPCVSSWWNDASDAAERPSSLNALPRPAASDAVALCPAPCGHGASPPSFASQVLGAMTVSL